MTTKQVSVETTPNELPIALEMPITKMLEEEFYNREEKSQDFDTNQEMIRFRNQVMPQVRTLEAEHVANVAAERARIFAILTDMYENNHVKNGYNNATAIYRKTLQEAIERVSETNILNNP